MIQDIHAPDDLSAKADRLREGVADTIAQADAHDDLAGSLTRFMAVTGLTVRVVIDQPGVVADDTTAAIDAPDEPAASGAAWTDAHNRRLMDLRLSGMLWRTIADALGRTPDACKTQYRKLVAADAERAAK